MSGRQHHGATLQPSSDEILREVENLRDIRRRSTAVGGPVIDPDLPWQGGSSDEGSLSSGEDRSSVEEPQTPADDPFHLFWVPARMHPEIDPSEFRSFLKEHARAPEGQLGRSGSVGSVGLGRKRSMLSRPYNPNNDRDSDEGKEEVSLRRNRTSYYASGPQLTIKDLEKLDQLAEEASQSSDPSTLRSVLRRSLSMNISPSAIDKMDSQPEEGDEADAPIFIPRQSQILRRAARTKIRKPGQVGEGSHRFTATRRGSARAAPDYEMPPDVPPLPATSVEGSEPRSSSELSSSEHDGLVQPRPRRATNDEIRLVERPDSYSAETFIYDAYAADDYDDKGAIIVSPLSPSQPVELPFHRSPSPPPTSAPAPVISPEPEPATVPFDLAIFDTSAPALSLSLDLQHPAPQRAVTLPGGITEPPRGESPDSIASTAATPVPATIAPISTPQPQPQPQPPIAPTPVALPSQPQPPVHGRTTSLEALRNTPSPGPELGGRKDKDRKGGLFKWGSSDKKSKKEKDKDRNSGGSASSHHAHSLSHEVREKEKEKEKEKDAGFFGSLFGGSKKKHEDGPPGLGHNAGREAAAALLGASKGRATATPSPSPGPGGLQPNNYSRYPIHVERAIYRLSHIKLANPRRPLYEQVLISNLMFWYLGVINKAQTQAQQPQVPQAGPGQQPPVQPPQAAQQPPAPQANGNVAPEQQAASQAQEEPEASRRRAGLTKGPAGAGGARRNEAPVRGPQYDLQHRAMEQERVYPAGGASPVKGRASVDSGREYEHVAHGHGVGGVNGRPALAHSQSQQQWQEQTQQARQALEQQQQRPDRSRSPPQNRYELGKGAGAGVAAGARSPSRSVSASAVAPVGAMQNGHGGAHHHAGSVGGGRASPGRKTQSAHAVAPGQGRQGRASEDEDVPLAMWQQQQQQRRGR